jgi:hypothetical protein
MGGIAMTDTSATTDLLTLIGRAIEQLQRSVTLLERREKESGVGGLVAVIDEIDQYLAAPREDPLLCLASLPASQVREGLLGVRADLSTVIDVLRRNPC